MGNNAYLLDTLAMNLYHEKGLTSQCNVMTLEFNMGFESFYGRASEDNEYQWVLKINGQEYKSRRWEDLNQFIQRVIKERSNGTTV